MEINKHLEQAEYYSRPLDTEIAAKSMLADQGHALRVVIYHGLVAIAKAIRGDE